MFDQVASLRKLLQPSPRTVICNALANPKDYLPCPETCCRASEYALVSLVLRHCSVSLVANIHALCSQTQTWPQLS